MKTPLFLALTSGMLAFAGSAQAQDFPFVVDQSNSNYTWSGTTSLGPLNGNPSNSFQVQGTMTFSLDSGGSPVGSGQWLAADLLVVPDLSGVVPNPIPLFPPLATIDVAGMRFSISSDPFTVDGSGNFNTTSILEVIAGTLTVTPLVGSPTVSDLTGTLGPASATSGNVVRNGNDMDMLSPMNTQFDFTDPTSGVSATITLVGNLTASYNCAGPANYCPVTPNSAGSGAVIGTTGSSWISDNSFGLTAVGAPANKPGIFFVGPNQVSLPLGDGTRCVGGAIKRLGVRISDGSGVFTQALDFNNLPNGTVIDPGKTQNFQCWFRDVDAGGTGFNLSDGTSVVFCP